MNILNLVNNMLNKKVLTICLSWVCVFLAFNVIASEDQLEFEHWFKIKNQEVWALTNRVDILNNAMEAEKVASNSTNVLSKAKALYLSASLYYRQSQGEDDFEKAKAIFTQVLELNPPEQLAVDSLRQLAQMELYSMNNPLAAEKRYEEIERKLNSETNSIPLHLKKIYLEDAYRNLIYTKQQLGITNTHDLRGKLLEVVSDSNKPEAYLTSARQLMNSGQKKEALEYFLKLFNEYPDYGYEDGKRINIELEKLDAYEYGETSDEYIKGLISLWDNPMNKNYIQLLNAGYHLISSLYEKRDTNFFKYAQQFKLGVSEALRTNSVENAEKYFLNTYQEQVFYRMAMFFPQDIHAQKSFLLDYITNFPKGLNIKPITLTYIELQDKLNDERKRESTQWKTRFFAFFIIVIAFIPIFFLSRKNRGQGPRVEEI